MTRRDCPKCGQSWYSADTRGVWTCERCGTRIGLEHEKPMEKEKPHEAASDNATSILPKTAEWRNAGLGPYSFAVQILSRGAYIDRYTGDSETYCYQTEAYTLRLNHVALNAYLLSVMNNCRECYKDGRDGDEAWAAHKAMMRDRREAWKARMLRAMDIGLDSGSVAIKQVQSEVFAAVWTRRI